MQRILSHMRKAIEEYNMIDEGDKIAVCLSGGKDSITMLHAFKSLHAGINPSHGRACTNVVAFLRYCIHFRVNYIDASVE